MLGVEGRQLSSAFERLCSTQRRSNRASIYTISHDGEPRDEQRPIELRQVYEDADENESFFAACWTSFELCGSSSSARVAGELLDDARRGGASSSQF